MRQNFPSLQISSRCSDAVGLAERDWSSLWGAPSCHLGPEPSLHSFPLPAWSTLDALEKHRLPLAGTSIPSVLSHVLMSISWRMVMTCPFRTSQSLLLMCCFAMKIKWPLPGGNEMSLGLPPVPISFLLLLPWSREMFILIKFWDLLPRYTLDQAKS